MCQFKGQADELASSDYHFESDPLANCCSVSSLLRNTMRIFHSSTSEKPLRRPRAFRQCARSQRCFVTSFGHLAIELMEQRQLFSVSAGSIPVDVGLIGQDSASGDWWMTRFDGDSYVQDSLASAVSNRQWQAPLVGDFDGDGKHEVAARDADTGIWWTLCNVQGTISTQYFHEWSTSESFSHFQVADVNGDGADDIIGQTTSGNWWSVCYVNGQYGNYWLGWWNSAIDSQNMLIGDFDGNGTADIAARDQSTGHWWNLRSINQSFFNEVMDIWGVQDTYRNLLVADINGDGADDIVGWSNTGDCLALAWNGDFFTNLSLGNWGLSERWQFISAGDFDGNGTDDVIAHDAFSGDWRATYSINGQYVTEMVAWWNPACTYSAVRVLDIDGDGRDEIVGQAEDGGWWVTNAPFQNNSAVWWSVNHYDEVLIADVDGDEREDLVCHDMSTGTWRALGFDGTSYVTNLLGEMPGDIQRSTLSADLDGDGHDTLLTWSQIDGTWWVVESGASAREQSPVATWRTHAYIYSELQQADFNGDGQLDLVTWDYQTGRWFLGLVDGTRNVTEHYLTTWKTDAGWQTPFYLDLDANGSTDLVTRDPSTGNWWAIRFDGTRYVSEIIANWNPMYGYSDFLVADIDADGRNEIIGRADYGGWWAIGFDGINFGNRNLGDAGLGNWSHARVADFDGNGADDIVAYDLTTGRWLAVMFDGTNLVHQVAATWDSQHDYVEVRVADFDGDFRDEIAARDVLTGEWMLIRWTIQGFDTRSIATWSNAFAWENVLVGDFNGDGRDEIVAQIGGGGDWWRLCELHDGWHNERIGTTQPVVGALAVDLDQDAISEVVWRDFATEDWHAIKFNGAILVDQVITPWNTAVDSQSVRVGQLPGFSDVSLRVHLLREIPALREALNNDPIHAAQLLVDWTANSLHWALTSSLANASTTKSENLSAAEIFIGYRTLQTAGYCGLSATFFDKVLKLFDFSSFIYDFGDLNDSLTHVTVIVPQLIGDKYRYFVVDPTFNLVFRNSTTHEYIDFFQMYHSVATGNFDHIAVDSAPVDDRLWLADQPVSMAGLAFIGLANERYAYDFPGYSFNSYMASIKSIIGEYGYSEGVRGFVELMANHAFRVGASLDPLARSLFIQELQNQGVTTENL
jgi:hypothetical protein